MLFVFGVENLIFLCFIFNSYGNKCNKVKSRFSDTFGRFDQDGAVGRTEPLVDRYKLKFSLIRQCKSLPLPCEN